MATTPQAILLELYEKLHDAYGGSRLPSLEDTQLLVGEVVRAGQSLQEIKPMERRPRRRGGPAESAPVMDPPSFPGPRR